MPCLACWPHLLSTENSATPCGSFLPDSPRGPRLLIKQAGDLEELVVERSTARGCRPRLDKLASDARGLENTRTQQHAQFVPADPFFGDLTVLEAEDDDGFPSHRLVFYVMSADPKSIWTQRRPLMLETHHHSVARFDQLVHLGLERGEVGPSACHHSAKRSQSLEFAFGPVNDAVGKYQVFQHLYPTSIEHLLKIAKHHLLLCGGRRAGRGLRD